MRRPDLDFAIVGGGLAGGLIALALREARPELTLGLYEAGESYGGNHRWSWFGSDLSPAGAALMAQLPAQTLGQRNVVRFPDYERTLAASYRSLDSRDFDAALRRLLPQQAVRTNTAVAALAADGITLADGHRVAARTVIDCRTLGSTRALTGGWQVFLGQEWQTDRPHGVASPVIMDAAVEQIGGYRFVYVLPLGPDRLFLEDTYYSNAPQLDAAALRDRLSAYAAENGWAGRVAHEETGVLPVVTGGDFGAYRAEVAVPGVTLAGARGGFFHPLTSYTVPVAVEAALAVAAHAALSGPELADAMAQRAQAHWNKTGFYRLLGKMLFDAAAPTERWRIFARFYRLPEPLIERFYAARSTWADQARVLSGRPPVPVGAALRALLGKGAPLVHDTQQ